MQTLKTPNVYRSEKDLSEITVAAGTSTGALVMSARKGVVNRIVQISTDKELIDTFGIPIPNGTDVGIYAGLQFLKESDTLYVVRATSGSEKYASISVSATAISGNTSTGIAASASTGSEENTLKTIADIDGATFNGTLLIASIGPGTYGNDVGVTVFTSAASNLSLSGNIDWAEKYEPTISGSIYKVSVFVKNTGETAFPLTAAEVFYCSNTYNKDSSGKQLFVKDVINGTSQYIYVNGKEDYLPGQIYSTSGGLPIALSGGANSTSTFTVPQLKQDLAWNLFKDTTKVSVNILMETLTTPNATPKTAEIAAYRLDCIACVQNGSVSAAYATILDTFPTCTQQSYVAVYAGWDKIYDNFNDREVYIPKSVFGACVMARTDRVARTWDAPAGTNRGILPSIAQNITFSDVQIGNLYDKNINTSRKIRGVGDVIWGQKTAQKKKSALDRINVRRLLLYIENSVEPSLQSFLFEPNTDKTRARVYDMVDSFMKGVKAGDGVTKYEVVCDTTNNTPQTIDSNELIVDVYVQPTKTIEYIRLNVVITRTGVNFSESR